LHKSTLPHAENVRSPRLTSVDKLTASLLKCNYVADGQEQLDAFKKQVPLSEHAELQKVYDAWRKSKPASKPYNAKPSVPTKKKTTLKVPTPKRNKGKNEEKKGGRR
jgi:hypothetical protein